MKLSTFDMRLFQAIVDLGSLSAAARHLSREKSTISRDLAALEARLGMRLLNRTTRSLSLTEAGEILIAYARRIAEETEAAEAALEGLDDEPRGLLRVTAPYALIRTVLTPRLGVFLHRYPDLRLALDPTTEVLDLVEMGIDVALRIGDLPPSTLVARKLAEVELILVVGAAYAKGAALPLHPADLAAHRLIDLSGQAGPTTWRLGGPEGEAEVALSPGLAAPDPGLVLDMAEAGLGIATIPRIYAEEGIGAGRLRHVLPGWRRGTRAIHAIYPSRRQLPPKVRVFIDFARSCLAMAVA